MKCDICTNKRPPRGELERGHVSMVANGATCIKRPGA